MKKKITDASSLPVIKAICVLTDTVSTDSINTIWLYPTSENIW